MWRESNKVLEALIFTRSSVDPGVSDGARGWWQQHGELWEIHPTPPSRRATISIEAEILRKQTFYVQILVSSPSNCWGPTHSPQGTDAFKITIIGLAFSFLSPYSMFTRVKGIYAYFIEISVVIYFQGCHFSTEFPVELLSPTLARSFNTHPVFGQNPWKVALEIYLVVSHLLWIGGSILSHRLCDLDKGIECMPVRLSEAI